MFDKTILINVITSKIHLALYSNKDKRLKGKMI